MKKIFITVLVTLALLNASAQVSSPTQKPANKETIEEGKKAATTGDVIKRDTTGFAAKRDSLLKVARSKPIPANPETSKYLLMQLMSALNNSAFKDTSSATKVNLFKSLKGLQDLDYLKIYMSKMIDLLLPEAFNKSWQKKESSWNKQLKEVKLPIEFNQLLVDFESQIKPGMFTQKWINENRTKWLGEMKRVK